MTPIQELIQRILVREGGVADVGDGMGITRWGQTPAWLATFSLPVPQDAKQAADNYQQWLIVTGLIHVIGPTTDELADIVIDIGVMSSAPKAFKALQAALKLPIDGVLGPATQRALDAADRKQLAREVVAWDTAYQGRLVTLDPSRAKYSAGWANRMADHIRDLS